MSRFNFNRTFNGYKVLVVDGFDVTIPRNPKDTSTYRISDIYGKGFNMMHTTALYDMLARVYLDFVVQNADSLNEHAAFISIIDNYCSHHSSEVNKKTIFLADRGFHSFNAFAHLIENDTYFVYVQEIPVPRAFSVLLLNCPILRNTILHMNAG